MKVNEYLLQELHHNTRADLKGYFQVSKNCCLPFTAGCLYSEWDLERIGNGELLADEFRAHGEMLIKNLIEEGRTYFTDYGIPIEEYAGSVEFDHVTCYIQFDRPNGAQLFLNNVYFDTANGKILQAEISFR